MSKVHHSIAFAFVFLVSSCSGMEKTNTTSYQEDISNIQPQAWPSQQSPLTVNREHEKKIAALLNAMTVEEKVGQIIQADINSVTPNEVREYYLGAVLNGGNSAPENNNRASAEKWLALADKFWLASTDKSDGRVGIPLLWGSDAVHGHNNIVGATIFPHNIGLGAANDPLLMAKIGKVTATEMRVTGLDWTFAPTLAVARNSRWGRTYESFSEDPAIVASYAEPLVSGIQGKVNTDQFLNSHHIISTAKHFIGDGGTLNGQDQGDNVDDQITMRDVHGAGYPPAIQAGVQVIMASFNSWHGIKMHGHKTMLTDVLVDQMGFDGFVVGDWNGHGQVEGCTNVSCANAFNAGLDMFMAPDSWKQLYQNTLEQVKSGEITLARLDQAVARILRVKLRAGLFDAGLPSSRPLAGNYKLLGSESHRAVAREAVRKSLVLLKNNRQLIPLSPNQRILVAGTAADNIGQASGGWTLSWQGTGNANSDFPNGQSILAAIKEAVTDSQGTVDYHPEGEFEVRPDVAIVVFGEQPYAEFQGDRPHVDFTDNTGLEVLKKFKALNIPTVSIFISGRPLWVNPEINASDAFIAAWLPGSEGGGIADVIMRNEQEKIEHDFVGRLSFSWPKSADQEVLNAEGADYDPLFALGYGLSVTDNVNVEQLNETQVATLSDYHISNFLLSGAAVSPWRLVLSDAKGRSQYLQGTSSSAGGNISVESADYLAQEDSIIVNWLGQGRFLIEGEPVDLERQSNGDMAIQIDYRVLSANLQRASIKLGCENQCKSPLDVTKTLQEKAGDGWQQGFIKLSCFADIGADMKNIKVPFELEVIGSASIQLNKIKVVANQGQASCQL
ncbi:glycoside hydrolase family 3 protein [Alteromonas mediterranea]|uniref:Beta-glucosidase n=1 Tax=Alteromonas mediterranea TaxID=314275 RepID=A0AAC8XMJ4_9ALTE|nr:exo 1,3/1,4-beta-D-glucan glucohydrolase [Alteromonas mediterranea]AFV87431.1 glucan 1,4-beta-glucosidase [Alteromonas mediterranea DE1]AGP99447.1 glucan 1,4-beta-glucosidase [Alteromonas mediterranea UM7]AGQ03605.1 glucan 1,4-beta-glucosidase [Alteromonas mediterranea UM4b]AMJ80308.1 beta-glucosidase [Alteromonas mediterranea]AMJ84464.1 beta-glucosidase [Alteromonas mediterranea]|tara:strand:+ start:25879 stop:28404 length:2526 start_codon:yes stop_codon:yes gene_type:complete